VTDPDFAALTDLASRQLGGSVVCASDELFADRENLIKPAAPVYDPQLFGNKGKIYDGWETRRRRGPGHDDAVVRLGCAGIVHGVIVDTAHFRGNYPPEISVEAVGAEGYPGPAELAEMDWETLVERQRAQADTANAYAVADRRRWTHIRLSIYPDGGVARLRVHGEVLADPRFLTGTVDLAALENGGRIVACSDEAYSSAGHLILPGLARTMAEGWENARRRGPGNDYVIVRLGAAGLLRHVEIDTSCFVGNAPGWVELWAADERSADPARAGSWREVLPRTRVQPDTRHRLRARRQRAATHVRVDVIPDGGLARLRVFGEVLPGALTELERHWRDALPPAQRALVDAAADD
jgi:allantoicase